MMTFEQIHAVVGNTPHVRVHSRKFNGASVYIKLEGQNPTGSIKDRTCLGLIQEASEAGRIKPGVTLLDASSGNLGCALAFYAKLMGHDAFVVSSSKLTRAKRDFIRYYGARIHEIGDFTIQGNEYCRGLVNQEPGRYCFLDQLHNWANPRAHYETTAPEILTGIPDLKMVVGSLGSGGSLLGVGQYMKERAPHVTMVAVQAAVGTLLPGTASLEEGDYVTPFIDKGFREHIFDYTLKVSESEAVAGTIQLRDQGIFGGLQTGGIFAATLKIARDLHMEGSVVLLSGDSGWKNMDKLLGICLQPPKNRDVSSQ